MVRGGHGVATAQQRRLARLREELVDAHAAFPVTGSIGDRLLEEIDYARFRRIHENRIATYGCLVPLGGDIGPVEGTEHVDLGDLPLELARPFADGRSSFLVHGRDRLSLLCSTTRSDDEAALVRLASSTDSYVVQRSIDGHVKVLSFGSVMTWQGVEWLQKPRADRFAAIVRHVVGGRYDRVVEGLLDLCVHWLSPSRCGSILALLGEGEDPVDVERPHHRPPPLSVTRTAHYAALTSVLTQTDGAALIDADGRLVGYGVGLLYSEDARNEVPAESGSRHTAARRYSYEHPRTVLFVTSEDGPVSVYAGGARILLVGGAGVADPGQPSVDHDRRGGQSRTVCAECGRVLIVRLSGDDRDDRAHDLRCPNCAVTPVGAATTGDGSAPASGGSSGGTSAGLGR